MSTPISDELVERISRCAIEEYQKLEDRSKQERHDRNLRNTKKLMRIMPAVRQHSDSSIAELADACDDDGLDVLIEMMHGSRGGVRVESVQRSVARTRLMIQHIDTMIEAYRKEAMASKREEVRRRYRVLEMMYLIDEPKEAEEIAEIEKIDKRTVYKDVTAACERLSYYIFGIDAF